jgi:hypothetical protein
MPKWHCVLNNILPRRAPSLKGGASSFGRVIGICYALAMSKVIANAVIVLAGSIMLIGAAIGLAIILFYCAAVVLLRKVKPSRCPALKAGT